MEETYALWVGADFDKSEGAEERLIITEEDIVNVWKDLRDRCGGFDARHMGYNMLIASNCVCSQSANVQLP